MPKTKFNQASFDFNFVKAIASYFGPHYTHFTRELAIVTNVDPKKKHSAAVHWARKGNLNVWRRPEVEGAAKKLPKDPDRDLIAEIKSLLDWGIA